MHSILSCLGSRAAEECAVSEGYAAWVGREEQATERIHASVVEAMAATLDLERSPQRGEPLPPGWQWLFFNPAARRGGLGIDGHPQRGGFLPPVELPRRMWAGSRIHYLADLPVDAEAVDRSEATGHSPAHDQAAAIRPSPTRPRHRRRKDSRRAMYQSGKPCWRAGSTMRSI